MADNPWSGPSDGYTIGVEQRVPERPRQGGEARLTALMENYIIRARPWQMFLGIIGFLLAGLMVLGGLGAGLMGLVGSAVSGGGPEGGVVFAILGLVYILLGAIYGYPAFLLVMASVAAGRLAVADDGADKELAAEDALRQTQNLFRFVGIITAVIMGLYALVLAFACMGGFVGAMSRI